MRLGDLTEIPQPQAYQIESKPKSAPPQTPWQTVLKEIPVGLRTKGGTMPQVVVLLLWALSLSTAHASIVNVLSPQVGQDEEGWASNAKLSLQHLAGNESKLALSMLAGTRWQAGKDQFLLRVSGDWGMASEEVYTKKAFSHLRYKRELGLHWRAFGFLQIDHNEFRSILMRDLAGGGVERLLVHTDQFEAAFAVGAMAELEWAVDASEPDPLAVRSTNYLTLAWQPVEAISFGSTTFFQPLISDLADIRGFQQADLRVNLTESVSWSTTWKLEYDSRPASSEVKEWDSSIKSGLVLSW